MAPDVCLNFTHATACAVTLEGALGFVERFAPNQIGIIAQRWQERDGKYVMEVFDWCNRWCPSPPVLAEILAPDGFTPTQEVVGL